MKTALVLACDDNFIAYASVFARRAVRLSAGEFPVVLVSDRVSEENKRLAQKFCSRITFLEAGDLLDGKAFHTHSIYSRATYLRLYLDEMLTDFDRAVYLDSDMTPLVDLGPLLNMVPKAAPVMATYSMGWPNDVVYDRLPIDRKAGLMQGGLQIYDLKAVREEGVFRDALQFALNHPEKCAIVDQDAINVALQGRWQVLDWRWNVMGFEARHAPQPFYIRHHGGRHKPWTASKAETEPYIVALWKQDLLESPWPEKYCRTSITKNYTRPISRFVETRVKGILTGDFETIRYGIPHHDEERQYLERLPALLAQIEAAARDGHLAKALNFANLRPRTIERLRS